MALAINCDMGESFGLYHLGDDEAIMPYISAANVGTSMPLQSIAACVIAGVSLRGGTGNVPYVVLGAIFFGVIENGMNVSGVSSYLQIGVTGAILIFAAVADEFRRRLIGKTRS